MEPRRPLFQEIQLNLFLLGSSKNCLESGTYKESQLPGLMRSKAPPAIRRLIADLLRRKPNQVRTSSSCMFSYL